MISTFTTAVCVTLVLLAIVSTLMNPFIRLPLRRVLASPTDSSDGEEQLPPISVIVMVNDDISTLEEQLPMLLSQDYAPGYQVIVVADKGNTHADDLINSYKDNPILSSTFIPSTSRYISREKLGITLGVKAAANEWCLLMDSKCYPNGKAWLKEMGRQCRDGRNIVIGYCNYDHDSAQYQRFYRMQHFAHIWHESLRGTTFASNGSNLAFRKSEFIGNDGFRGNLHIIRGEYDFIVNKLSKKRMTAVVCSADAMMTEKAPGTKGWNRRRVFYLHSRGNMQRRFGHCVLPCLDALFLHLAWLAAIAATVLSAITADWVMLSAAIASMLTLIIGRTLVDRKASAIFGAAISTWSILPLELTSIWHTLGDIIRYRKADSYDFTCHKL